MKVEKKVFLAKIRHSLRRIEVTVSCLINHKKRIEAKLATAVNYATPITKGMQQGRNGYRVFNQDIQIQSTYLPIRICLPRMSQYDQFFYGQPMVEPRGIFLFQDTLSLFQYWFNYSYKCMYFEQMNAADLCNWKYYFKYISDISLDITY